MNAVAPIKLRDGSADARLDCRISIVWAGAGTAVGVGFYENELVSGDQESRISTVPYDKVFSPAVCVAFVLFETDDPPFDASDEVDEQFPVLIADDGVAADDGGRICGSGRQRVAAVIGWDGLVEQRNHHIPRSGGKADDLSLDAVAATVVKNNGSTCRAGVVFRHHNMAWGDEGRCPGIVERNAGHIHSPRPSVRHIRIPVGIIAVEDIRGSLAWG